MFKRQRGREDYTHTTRGHIMREGTVGRNTCGDGRSHSSGQQQRGGAAWRAIQSVPSAMPVVPMEKVASASGRQGES